MRVPDHPNDPAYVPTEVECEWPDCGRVDTFDDPMFGWLCSDHSSEAYTEYHADNMRKQQKEDEIT